MSENSHKRIVDWFSKIPGISDDLRNEFGLWLAEHEDDPELDSRLYELWKENAPANADDADGDDFIRTIPAIDRPKRPVRRAAVSIAAAVILALFFVGGYFLAKYSCAPQKPIHEITILTAEGNVARHNLPDGSQVWLNGGSSLTYYAGLDGDKRVVELDGEGFFKIEKDSLRPFRLVMGDVNVEVLGTMFDAINYAETSTYSVILKNGSVRLTSELLGRDVFMNPGDKVDIDKESGHTRVDFVDAQNYCQWFSSRLTFDNTPISDLIVNLERRYNVTISVSGDFPLSQGISIVVGDERLEEILDVICSLTEAGYKIDGRHVTIK